MIDLLEKTRVFAGASRDELGEIAKICQRVTAEKGELIFEAGTPADCFYVVSEGLVELRFNVTHYNATRALTFDKKLRGDAFGWSALTEPRIYTGSALAVRNCELLKFDAADVGRLCDESARLGFIVMKNISEIIAERFATLQMMFFDLVQANLTQREP